MDVVAAHAFRHAAGMERMARGAQPRDQQGCSRGSETTFDYFCDDLHVLFMIDDKAPAARPSVSRGPMALRPCLAAGLPFRRNDCVGRDDLSTFNEIHAKVPISIYEMRKKRIAIQDIIDNVVRQGSEASSVYIDSRYNAKSKVKNRGIVAIISKQSF